MTPAAQGGPDQMRLAVLGVGLVGGSIGLAARSRTGAHVIGYDPEHRALSAALELGAIDEAASSVAEAVSDADVVFVAAPVGTLAQTVRAALDAAGPQCVVSDVGSTKRAIMSAIDDERFIGGHPLAGAETAGVEHARADLFDGATWYLTPPAAPSERPPAGTTERSPTGSTERRLAAPSERLPAGSSQRTLEHLRETISAFGAQPVTIGPLAHDRLMARLSHLPHVLANVLVSGAARALAREQRSLDGALLGAGPSLRDATRVAGANSSIWVDIYISNSDALIEAIDEAIDQLQDVRAALSRSDAAALTGWNERARGQRTQMTAATPTPGA